MNILFWIVFGLIVGGISNFIMPGSKGGIIGSIVLGILGAVVGGFIGEQFFGVGVTGFNLMSVIVAVAGSLLLVFVGKTLSRAN